MVRTLSVAGLGAGITVAATGAAFAADYKVKAGDTLSEIAQANGADWHQLAELNNLKDPDLILIGQTLKLDGVKTATAPKRVTPKKVETKKVRKATTERKARTSRSAERPSSNNGGSVSMSAAWRKVAQCESSGNPRAVSPNGKYFGLFQFDKQTWRSVGGTGSPAKASAAEQLMRAKKLYAQRGNQPWPVCGRFLP
ncbi:transglycosylase family protein [Kribbella sandramycini]|uniref:LysM repeat protein n=1 Tax=Kribbella sandramycini TaxID=60450 RepID=A0A841S7Z3_9ACTN|nr:LysM repeat protein [Kribbella sandramycini]